MPLFSDFLGQNFVAGQLVSLLVVGSDTVRELKALESLFVVLVGVVVQDEAQIIKSLVTSETIRIILNFLLKYRITEELHVLFEVPLVHNRRKHQVEVLEVLRPETVPVLLNRCHQAEVQFLCGDIFFRFFFDKATKADDHGRAGQPVNVADNAVLKRGVRVKRGDLDLRQSRFCRGA